MSERHLQAKIVKLKGQLKKRNAAYRGLRQRHKELSASYLHQKEKVRMLRRRLDNPRQGINSKAVFSPVGVKIARHKYDLQLISLCVRLYAFAGCSFRGVLRVLHCFQLEMGLRWSELPSKSSVENWVQKLGYHTYLQYGQDLFATDYCLVIDESIVIGQQRMLLVLGLPAHKTGEEALSLGDVRVLGLEVKPAWSGADIAAVVQKVQEKMGKSARYAISDGGSNLKKGIADVGLVRVCDVGHELAKILEHTYQSDPIFNAFTKMVAQLKFKEVLKQTAYLLPPKQRTIARFMNLSPLFEWAAKMLRTLPHLSLPEQQVFSCLTEYRALIVEMEAVFKMINQLLTVFKKQGISIPIIEQCLSICQQYAKTIPSALSERIKKYLAEEKSKLPDQQTVWNASSDVIESLFGKFKSRKAPNNLHGITPLCLTLCVYTHFGDHFSEMKPEIAQALKEVSMADLTSWKRAHLTENQVVKRNKTLKK